MEYNHQKIEEKWRKIWEEDKTHKTNLYGAKKPYYCLDMFPYPSGEGLHVGHWRGYVLSDVWARYKKMQSYDILHPMGWDAFGLPAENYAIKHSIHPKISTESNIQNIKRQLKQIGAMYDWNLEINTTDPDYYKWTQWIFVKMFKKGLAYQKKMPVNWCPSCKTVLADEEVAGGECERCGTKAEKKELKQWMLKITAYADRLIEDLDKLNWPEKVKIMQRNWIGRSEGAEIKFKIINEKLKNEFIKVFTTRPDTLFGASYIVLAPEHPKVLELTTKEKQKEVEEYINQVKKEDETERLGEEKEKTGVFIGSYVINPVNNKKVPIWISDYVLLSYATGAIMAVPAHDQRDFEFAQKFNLPAIEVISPNGKTTKKLKRAYLEEGILINSGKFNGTASKRARKEIVKWLKEKNLAQEKVNYKMRDWIYSRQRYWGEPIPIIYCKKCGTVPVPEDQLPVKLPEVEKYQPTVTGRSPLASISKFVNTKCPKCRGKAKRETDTMPQWAGSSWYFLRYPSANYKKAIFDENLTKKWLPVDQYVGGVEHAILHLLYARFFTKFLFDIKVIDFDEPFLSLFNQGMIYYKGAKMSKSKGNVVSPDEMVEKFGADTVRGYELFMGPPDQDVEWNDNGIEGVHRFLKRVWRLVNMRISDNFNMSIMDPDLQKMAHKTVRRVTDDLERFHFNTIVSTLMEYVNYLFLIDEKKISKDSLEILLLLLAPIAPHIAEELWKKIGHKNSIFRQRWPEYDQKLTKEEEIELVVQINGKLRDRIKVPADIIEKEVLEIVLKIEKIKKFVKKEPKKIIFVPGKLINIVV